MSKSFHTLKVKAVRPETQDAVTVFFEVPDALSETFQYLQGQYLTLKFPINGQEVRRAYSMCSSPIDEDIAVTVKRVKKGVISNYINDNLQAGQTVEVMPPDGRFYTELDADQRKSYYLFGAGSGITPLMSILRTILEKEPQSNIHLLYGNRNEDCIIFKDQLDELEKRYAGQLHIEHILSRPKREKAAGLGGLFKKGKINWAGKIGRIGPDSIREFLDAHPSTTKASEYFICGPGDMIDVAENTLMTLGVDKENIHTERFSSTLPGEQDTTGDVAGATLVAHLNGETIEVKVPEGKTILDVLIDNKYDPPYSCTSGACSTCMAKVVKGSARMDACFALDDDEVAEGYILTCQSHPTSEEIEVTYGV